LIVLGSFCLIFLTYLSLHVFSSPNPLQFAVDSPNPMLFLFGQGNDLTVAVLALLDIPAHRFLTRAETFLRASYADNIGLAGLVALLQAFFLTFLLVVFAFVMALAANIIMRLVPLGIGGHRFVDSLFARLSFTLVPVTARHIRFEDVTSERGFLKHVTIHEDGIVLERIVKAITEYA